ncbi:hypothetical protein DL95DRAFT_75095 [Leptodontidium sp. 2 PMI_412]|nr:hypothetical protein DL95DRAFT_75095 [Leptodontidium sp. 2 PMI_412]
MSLFYYFLESWAGLPGLWGVGLGILRLTGGRGGVEVGQHLSIKSVEVGDGKQGRAGIDCCLSTCQSQGREGGGRKAEVTALLARSEVISAYLMQVNPRSGPCNQSIAFQMQLLNLTTYLLFAVFIFLVWVSKGKVKAMGYFSLRPFSRSLRVTFLLVYLLPL